MLTIKVEGELEARLRARANQVGSPPDNFALAALERGLEEGEDWTPLQKALSQHGGKGVLPALLPENSELSQPKVVGAFKDDPEWDAFLQAIAQEREQANVRAAE